MSTMNSEVYDEIKASLLVIKWMVGFVVAMTWRMFG